MYGYIYETTNLINGKKYIGQHVASEFDPNYKGSGKYLWRAINAYGWSNFSARMLCPCFSQEELDAEEIDYIAHCNAVESPDYYNLQAGGQVGNISGSKLSDSTRRKMSELRKGRDLSYMQTPEIRKKRGVAMSRYNKKVGRWQGDSNPSHNKTWTEEDRKDWSLRLTGEGNPFYGKKHSEETKLRISQGRLGSNNPCYKKIWITKDGINKRVNPAELNVYISEGWKKGRYVSDETRRKHSESCSIRERDSSGKFL